MTADVRVLNVGAATVVEVDAPPAGTLDIMWRQRLDRDRIGQPGRILFIPGA